MLHLLILFIVLFENAISHRHKTLKFILSVCQFFICHRLFSFSSFHDNKSKKITSKVDIGFFLGAGFRSSSSSF